MEGNISPIAWTIIGALSAALTTVSGVLWAAIRRKDKEIKRLNEDRVQFRERMVGRLKRAREEAGDDAS